MTTQPITDTAPPDDFPKPAFSLTWCPSRSVYYASKPVYGTVDCYTQEDVAPLVQRIHELERALQGAMRNIVETDPVAWLHELVVDGQTIRRTFLDDPNETPFGRGGSTVTRPVYAFDAPESGFPPRPKELA